MPDLERYAIKLKNKLFFGEIISIGIEAYFEFLISGYLAVYADIMTVDGEVLSTIMGWFSLIITCIIMPITLLWLLTKPLKEFHHPRFEEKFGAYFEDLSYKDKFKLSFCMIFMMRRILFVVTSIFVLYESL